MFDNFTIKLAKLKQKFTEGKRSNHWPTIRRVHLAQFPTCAACGGVTKIEVHHKEPFHIQPELELTEANLITLCESKSQCHFIIGHNRNWKGFNPSVVADAAEMLVKTNQVR